jgi:hypothetical protein
MTSGSDPAMAAITSRIDIAMLSRPGSTPKMRNTPPPISPRRGRGPGWEKTEPPALLGDDQSGELPPMRPMTIQTISSAMSDIDASPRSQNSPPLPRPGQRCRPAHCARRRPYLARVAQSSRRRDRPPTLLGSRPDLSLLELRTGDKVLRRRGLWGNRRRCWLWGKLVIDGR